jgi:hypothetical protein
MSKTAETCQYIVIRGGTRLNFHVSGYLKCNFTWKGRCPVERRFRLIFLDQRLVEVVLNWKQHEFIQLPIFPDLPDDVTFHQLHYDPNRQAFGVCIHSKEFEVVPKGLMIPEIDGIYKFQLVQLPIEEEEDEEEGKKENGFDREETSASPE